MASRDNISYTTNSATVLATAPAVFSLCLIYLDVPQYLFSLDVAPPPKYWYFALAVICAPYLYMALLERRQFYCYAYMRWAVALLLLMFLHLLIAWSEGELTRTKDIVTSMQYIIFSLLLCVSLSAVPISRYAYLFPVLSVIIGCLIITDFLKPGTFYGYDLSETPPTAVLGRGAGTFINSNKAGEALAITLLLSVCLFRGWLILLLLLFAGIASLLTFSRAAIIVWVLLSGVARYTNGCLAMPMAYSWPWFLSGPAVFTMSRVIGTARRSQRPTLGITL